MDAPIVAIVSRTFVATLLAVGGLISLRRGSGLITRHLGDTTTPPHTFRYKVGGQEVSFSTGTAGVAVVLASVFWVAGAVRVAPSLTRAAGREEISQVRRTPAPLPSKRFPNFFEPEAEVLKFQVNSAELTPEQKDRLATLAGSAAKLGTRHEILLTAEAGPTEKGPKDEGKLNAARLETARESLLGKATSNVAVEVRPVKAGDAFAKIIVEPASPAIAHPAPRPNEGPS